jgi:peptidoglycan/LPS O-acetylase OafA/YrhL
VLIGAVAILMTIAETVFHRHFPESRTATIVTAFVGTLIFRVFSRDADSSALKRLLPAVFVLLLVEFYLCYEVPPLYDFTFVSASVTWIAAYAVFFAAYNLRNIQWPSALKYLGKISYSIYLTHMFFMLPMYRLHWGWPGEFIYIAAVIALSSVTYYLIEAPGIRLGKQVALKLLHKREDELAAQQPM